MANDLSLFDTSQLPSPNGRSPQKLSRHDDLMNTVRQTIEDVLGDTSVMKDVTRTDGWRNAISGLGTSVDKRTYTKYSVTNSTFPTKYELSMYYTNEGLLRKIVDTFPDDMTRQWIELEGDEKKKGKKKGTVENDLDRLSAQVQFNAAQKWADLMGGSLMFVEAVDGNGPEQPLEIDNIRDILGLTVFDLGEIETPSCEFDYDPKSETFGKIKLFKIKQIVGTTIAYRYIHASRCIEFHGRRVPPSYIGEFALESRYWGTSVCKAPWDTIKDFSAAFGSVSQILYEFIIGKYKLADLDMMLAEGNEGALNTRMQAIDLTKSLIRAVLLGTDEDYVRDSVSLTGISDLLDRFMMKLAGETDYPVTKLFGRAAAGLNATGENDLRNYYDSVQAKQKTGLTPNINQLIKFICAYRRIKDAPTICWLPLMQLNELDKAEANRRDAEAYRTKAAGDQLYIQESVLDPDMVYKMRFEEELGSRSIISLTSPQSPNNDPNQNPPPEVPFQPNPSTTETNLQGQSS